MFLVFKSRSYNVCLNVKEYCTLSLPQYPNTSVIVHLAYYNKTRDWCVKFVHGAVVPSAQPAPFIYLYLHHCKLGASRGLS